jgi:hypothetical protein
MFELTKQEAGTLLLQNARANTGRGGLRTPPFAFTEHGVAMLSSVLKSERAVQMNIAIVRAFIHMRELMASNKDIAARVHPSIYPNRIPRRARSDRPRLR